MKKIPVIVAIVCLLLSVTGNICISQTPDAVHDERGTFVLVPYVPPQAEAMPETAETTLLNKLDQIANMNGAGPASGSMSWRFIIAAKTTVLSKDVLSTSPPGIAYNLKIDLYIGDGFEGKKFASTSLNVKGIGANETKAWLNAVNSINADNATIKNFVANGRGKIIDYYNTQCDEVIKQANALATRKQYAEALDLLSSVPSDCKACFIKSTDATIAIYKRYIEYDCNTFLTMAKAVWAASPDANGAAAAAAILITIDPDAKDCYKDAQKLTEEVKKTMTKNNDKAWDLLTKIEHDNFLLASQMVKSVKSVSKTKKPAYKTTGL